MIDKWEHDAISEYLKDKVSPHLQAVINTLRQDLYYGPVYTDGHGNELSCFDEGAQQFNFSKAAALVNRHLDLNTVYYEDWSGCIVETIPEDADPDFDVYYEIDLREHVLGRELAQTI